MVQNAIIWLTIQRFDLASNRVWISAVSPAVYVHVNNDPEISASQLVIMLVSSQTSPSTLLSWNLLLCQSKLPHEF